MTQDQYDVAIRADHLYVTGKDAELIELARSLWPRVDGPLPANVGDVFRLARLACIRQADARSSSDPDRKSLFADIDLFEAHGITAATLDGDAHVIAGFLLPRFFSLTKLGDFSKARLVLDDMARLVVDGSEQLPYAKVLRRLIAEKRAYSFFAEGKYRDAIVCYRDALTFIPDEAVRSRLKVRGGIALTKFMASAKSQVDVEALRCELEEISSAATSAPAPDVAGWADENLQRIEGKRLSEWVPFEAP